MSNLTIQVWRKLDCYAEFDSKSMAISQVKKIDKAIHVDGFVKTFLLGKNIIVYKQCDEWFVMVNESSSPLSEIKNITVTHNFGFTILSFVLNKMSLSFWDFTPLEALSRGIDPTYDDFDSEYVFGCWFMGLSQLTTSITT